MREQKQTVPELNVLGDGDHSEVVEVQVQNEDETERESLIDIKDVDDIFEGSEIVNGNGGENGSNNDEICG